MRILVSGSTRIVSSLSQSFPNHLGHLLSPDAGNRCETLLKTGLFWGADNSAFSGFDEARFLRFLDRIANKPRCLFVVAPDVVADAGSTVKLFWSWRQRMKETGHPIAFVGQDGAEKIDTPWDYFEAYFVGGSTSWKLGSASVNMVAEAKRRGKHVHMGRVNSLKRLRWALRIGCDSCDGSGYSRFHHLSLTGRPDMSLSYHLRFLVAQELEMQQQRQMFC